MPSIKIDCNSEIRIYKGQSEYIAIRQYIEKNVKNLPKNYRIVYNDEEGDEITIACQEDVETLIELQPNPKLYVVGELVLKNNEQDQDEEEESEQEVRESLEDSFEKLFIQKPDGMFKTKKHMRKQMKEFMKNEDFKNLTDEEKLKKREEIKAAFMEKAQKFQEEKKKRHEEKRKIFYEKCRNDAELSQLMQKVQKKLKNRIQPIIEEIINQDFTFINSHSEEEEKEDVDGILKNKSEEQEDIGMMKGWMGRLMCFGRKRKYHEYHQKEFGCQKPAVNKVMKLFVFKNLFKSFGIGFAKKIAMKRLMFGKRMGFFGRNQCGQDDQDELMKMKMMKMRMKMMMKTREEEGEVPSHEFFGPHFHHNRRPHYRRHFMHGFPEQSHDHPMMENMCFNSEKMTEGREHCYPFENMRRNFSPEFRRPHHHEREQCFRNKQPFHKQHMKNKFMRFFNSQEQMKTEEQEKQQNQENDNC